MKKNGLHIEEDGTKCWYRHDKCHREDGPAVEWASGEKYWYVHGELHREDGPAAEFKDGATGWYLNDMYLGKDAKGFWTLWEKLTPEQQNNISLHMWLAKYSAIVSIV